MVVIIALSKSGWMIVQRVEREGADGCGRESDEGEDGCGREGEVEDWGCEAIEKILLCLGRPTMMHHLGFAIIERV